MRRSLLAATFALFAVTVPALAHDHGEAKPASGGEVRTEILNQLQDAEKKIMALAEAMPAEKYTWRPAEKILSTGEVFMHVAGGNYFLPTFWGVKPGEGINPRGFEQDGGDKAKVLATLKASFEHVRKAIQDAPEADLAKQVDMFGSKRSMREAMMITASHAHEHLGQSIAYARMNGVAPPWSAGE